MATEYNAGSREWLWMNLQPPGIRLCLDDFGSGYANLNTVMKLPFSTIKLDQDPAF